VSSQKPLPLLVSKFGRTVFTIPGESISLFQSTPFHIWSQDVCEISILTPVTVKSDMTSSNVVEDFKIFGGTYHLRHRIGRVSRAVTQAAHACLSRLVFDPEDGAVRTSEMPVDFYCTTRCHISEDVPFLFVSYYNWMMYIYCFIRAVIPYHCLFI
jgi:hypothetical protein